MAADPRVQDILDRALADIAGARSTSALEQVRVRVLGRSGELTALLRGLGKVPAADRPRVGQEANEVKGRLEEALAARQDGLRTEEHRQTLAARHLDLTLPGRVPALGAMHPIIRVQDEIISIFEGLGFSVAEGPEVESDYYNFAALNFPDDHPARDMQDTFHVSADTVLRTHTSPVQIRAMKAQGPPVRIVCPGKVFRHDITDATHSPMFHQIEGLAVDRHITMADLKGTLDLFAREMFGPRSRVRFRPSFFPFTEPSAEVDVLCFKCGGDGCRFCKQSGWIEILGSGMVHPNVLRNVGYDPEELTGWAFGMGVERVAILKYEIDDIRLFFENDMRFLGQFASLFPGAAVKISYRWLREFAETELPPAAIADRLVNAGIEVASVQPLVEGLSGVVIAEIEAIEQDLGVTPAGHHNRLCRVALPDKSFSVVCGAPNAASGLRTAFAPPGATLPGGRAIKAAKIRGTVSEGMLCSEQELGIGQDGSGILELPTDAPLGAPLSRYLGLDDTILEIEITPNRPDALSVVGVAREVAALTGAPFRFPQIAVKEGETDAARIALVEILDPDLCPRYAARVITGLTVKPSPPWLAQRLRSVGLRPINNLVDVTNYVLWEMGQPLHAFDYDTVAQHKIVVRRAQPGERITTLDGQDRALTPGMLLICDPERPVGIAGVMGGASTEVTAKTTTVLLESAFFNPGSIRSTSRTLGLHTDAAYRFERGADIEGLREALDRAAQLMADLGGGTVAKGVIDVYPGPKPRPRITLRRSRIERVIGVCPPHEDVVRILQALGFAVDDSGLALQVVVPSFRRDIVQEDDLVEEVIRVWGYDKIPSALAGGGVLQPVIHPPALVLARAVTRALTSAGLSQAVTYAFVDPARLKAMGWDAPEALIALQNPISAERSVLQPSLAPGVLEVVALNGTRQIPDVRLFEIGQTFAPHREEDGDRPAHEELWLAVAMTGQRAPRAWYATRDRIDIYDVKGAAELAVHAAGVGDAETTPYAPGEGPRYLEQGRAAALSVSGRPVGWFGEVALGVREAFDLPAPVFLAELSLSALLDLPRRETRYQPLPRFPAVQRDLAIVVAAEVTAGQIEAAIRSMKLPLLSRLTLFDVYEGGQVGAGKRSLAWSLTFQAPDRTLTDREVNELHARIVAEISRRFGAEIRGV